MLTNHFVFDAIGTKWQISLESLSPQKNSDIQNVIQKRINEFDITYSRFRKESVVSRMAEKVGDYRLPDDAGELLSLYEVLYKLTDGAFTPLIGKLLSDAGYDASYSLKPKALQCVLSWEESIAYEYPYLTIKKPALLDFGAAGKGYLVDIVANILKTQNIHAFCINAGGDIFYQHPKKPLRVGLENPLNFRQVIGIASIQNESICGSAGNRRKWSEYHHIFNPHTKSPVGNILATWVVAQHALIADALATALFFTPAKILAKKFDFSYAFIEYDFRLEKSSDFPAEFFLSEYTGKRA